MLELAVQQRITDFIGLLEEETGADRLEICNFAYNWGNGRLPGPDEALEALRRGEDNIKAGRHKPGKEVVENLWRAVEPYM